LTRREANVTTTLDADYQKPGLTKSINPISLINSFNQSKFLSPGLAAPLFLLGLFLLPGCMPPGPRAVLEGKRLIEQGKYSKAVEILKRATSLMATNAQAWNYLGLACHNAGQADQAERCYQRALALDHDLSEAHYNLACLCLAQNRPDRTSTAITELLAYTLRRGNSAEALLKLGLAQLRSRELLDAEKSFTAALHASASPAALNGLGLVRFQRGRADEAARFFREALKRQADYRPALLNLAIVSQQYLNDYPAALQSYRQYAKLKPPPDGAETASALARQLESMLKPAPRPAALVPAPRSSPVTNATSSASKAAPTNVVRVVAAPKNETATNPPKPAASAPAAPGPMPAVSTSAPPGPNVQIVKLSEEPVVRPAQDLSSPPAESQTVAAAPMLSNPQPSGTTAATNASKRAFLERINPLNLFRGPEKKSSQPAPLPPVTEPGEPQPLVGGTQGLNGEPNAAGAGATLSRYHYTSPPRPRAGNRAEAERFFALGLQAQAAHRTAEAMQDYRQATQSDPSFFDAHYNTGSAATETGDLSAALAAYENALAARPESLDARYNFARVLKQAGYVVDAANELEKLLATYPNDGRANLALGNIYAQQLQQPAKARQHYLKVLESDPHNPQAGAIQFWLAGNPP
jgi:tetratricopeptide (TPR) repeat protein